MPSESHQTLLLLFRRYPKLAVDLAREAGALLEARDYELAEFATESEDPEKPESPVFSDRVITGKVEGRYADAIVIEVQMAPDASKAATMLLYMGSVWRELDCHTWTLFFSPRRGTIEWARRTLYPRRPELVPLLVTHDLIPPITSFEIANSDIARAVLSTVLHGKESQGRDCAIAAIAALREQRPQDYERYIRLILSSLTKDDMQQIRETLPKEIEYEVDDWEREGSSFQRGLDEGRELGLEQGREQGRELGLERGREQGLEQGRELGREQGREALQRAILEVLQARGLAPDDVTTARIRAVSSLDTLVTLVERAATIAHLDQL